MTNLITIRFSGRTPSPKEMSIGMETDSGAETLKMVLPEITNGQIATLQMILPDGTAEVLEIENGETLIPARIMEISGTARAWVQILAGNVIAWNSEIMYMGIGALPEISDRTEQQYPTALQDAIFRSETAKQQAESAAAAAMAAAGDLIMFNIEDGHLIMYGTDETSYDFRLEEGRLILYGNG